MTIIETLDNPIICDMTLPWFTDHMVDQDITLPRFKKAGVDFVSLTVSVPEKRWSVLKIVVLRLATCRGRRTSST